MMLRSPDGATYVAGLVRATGVPHDGGAKTAPVNVVVQAVDAQGKTSAQKEREVTRRVRGGRLAASPRTA